MGAGGCETRGGLLLWGAPRGGVGEGGGGGGGGLLIKWVCMRHLAYIFCFCFFVL